MKAKFLVYALPALIFTIIHLAEAQQAKKTPRIGLLNFGPAEDYRRQQPFLAGLRDLGWVEKAKTSPLSADTQMRAIISFSI